MSCYTGKAHQFAKADILSRGPAFTSTEGGTISATHQTVLRKEQWFAVGAMPLQNDDVETIQLSVLDIEALLPEANASIQEESMHDNHHREVCKHVASQWKVNQEYAIKDDLLCDKNRIYVPEGMRPRIIESEHESKVAGNFRRDRTVE